MAGDKARMWMFIVLSLSLTACLIFMELSQTDMVWTGVMAFYSCYAAFTEWELFRAKKTLILVRNYLQKDHPEFEKTLK